MKKRILISAATMLGIIFLLLSLLYFVIPAGSLPTYFIGYEAGSTHIHLKHAIASLVIALGLFAFAWFKSGTKSAN